MPKRGVKRSGRKVSSSDVKRANEKLPGRMEVGEEDLDNCIEPPLVPRRSSAMTLLRQELDRQRIPKAAMDKRVKDELEELGIGAGALESSDEETAGEYSCGESSRRTARTGLDATKSAAHCKGTSSTDDDCERVAETITHALEQGGEVLKCIEAESAHKPKLTIALSTLNVHHLCRCALVSPVTTLSDLERLEGLKHKLNELEVAFLCSRHLPLRDALLRRFHSPRGIPIALTFYEVTSVLQFVCENRDASLLVRRGDNALFDAAVLLQRGSDHEMSQKARLCNCLLNVEDFLRILSSVDYSSWKHKQLTKFLIALCRIYVDHDSSPLREPISLAVENIVKSLSVAKAKRTMAKFASHFDEIDSDPLAALRVMTMLSFHNFFIHHRLKAILRLFQKFLGSDATDKAPASKSPRQATASILKLKVNNADLKAVVEMVPQIAHHLMTRRSELYVLFQLLDLAITTKAISSEKSDTLSAYIEILTKAETYLKSNDIDGAVIASINNARHRLTLVRNRGYNMGEWTSDDEEEEGKDGEEDDSDEDG